jgi:cytochrome c oxidase subunit IV
VSDTPGSHAADAHAAHGPNLKAYLVVFGTLCGFTLLSFIFNYLALHGVISHFFSFVLILSVAIVKATLVAMFFMHLKWDWTKLYYLIIPVMILAVMLGIVLLPDIVLAWHH